MGTLYLAGCGASAKIDVRMKEAAKLMRPPAINDFCGPSDHRELFPRVRRDGR
jgi:hypothetical protein